MPRHVIQARFDQGTRRVSCTEDTRTEVLQTIYNWFSGRNREACKTLSTTGNADGRIFWLDGVAGTGKSTIAQTVADHFDETHQLGASFFCSRDDAGCGNVALV